jgi:hypothetical protein
VISLSQEVTVDWASHQVGSLKNLDHPFKKELIHGGPTATTKNEPSGMILGIA